MIDTFSALEGLLRWMAWRLERRGSVKALPTKVPYSASGAGNYGSSTDPATWGVRTQAEARAAALRNDSDTVTGIGIALGEIDDQTTLLGIDLDSCFDENRKPAPWATEILETVGSYAEVSPSGRGLKVFAYAPTALIRPFLDMVGVETDAFGTRRSVPGLGGANHGPAIEIYCAARYFTVTEELWDVAHQDIAHVDDATLGRLARLLPGAPQVIAKIIPDVTGSSPRPSRGFDDSRSGKALRAALALACDTYEEMVDGLRGHPDPDIRAWIEDKGLAHNERELKRIWKRFVAKRAMGRLLGLDDLEARSGTETGDDLDEPEPEVEPEPEPGGSGELPEPPEPPLEPEPGDDDDDSVGLAALDAEELERRRSALKAATDAKLAELNTRYCVCNEGGKVYVVEWRFDPVLGREVLDRISFDDFKRLYLNRTIKTLTRDENGNTQVGHRNLADWWLRHRRRQQFVGGVTFDPTNRARDDYMNLWRGFGVMPVPGDWSLMREHIEKVICGGEPAHAEYLLDWSARMVQRPELPGEVAVVLRSDEEGTGKGILGRYLVAMLGRHGLQIGHAGQLTGRFNDHLRDLVFLFADEAFFAGDQAHEGVLKGLITEYTVTIEGKYRSVFPIKNMLHILMSSNRDWVIPAALTARRFFMLEALDTRLRQHDYFKAIAAQMDNGGLAAMLHDLLHRDISGFEVREIPHTAELVSQKLLSLNSLERWWSAVLDRGFVYASRHGAPHFGKWHEFCALELLWQSYLQWCEKNRPTDRKPREALNLFMIPMYGNRERRPRGLSAIAEVEVVHALEFDPTTGLPQDLDKLAIHWQDRPRGFTIGTIDEATDRFHAVHPGASE
jgi:hypothetical protein